MHLLTLNQTKMLKSEGYGWTSAALNLSPAKRVPKNDLGIKNTCSDAGVCANFCLKTTGRNRFDVAENARERKTDLLFTNPRLFWSLLDADLALLETKGKVTARLNCLSDIPFERYKIGGKTVFERFPRIQFLDYTKTFDRLSLNIPNYEVVYSYNEKSVDREVRNYLVHGGRVAVVFNADEIPTSYKIGNTRFEVVNGDEHDLLHLRPQGVILGLKYKKAFSPRTGKQMAPPKKFVVTLEA